MADIDILLAVRGQRQSIEGLSKVQAGVLRMQEGVSKGAASVTAFDGVWREFNATGTVSISTLGGLASALPGLASPAAAATAAIGLLVMALLKTISAQKKLESMAFKADVAGLEKESRIKLRIAKETFGQSEAAAKLLRERIIAEEEFTDLLERRRREVENLEKTQNRTAESGKTGFFAVAGEIITGTAKIAAAGKKHLDPAVFFGSYEKPLDDAQKAVMGLEAELQNLLATESGVVTGSRELVAAITEVQNAASANQAGTFDYEEWLLQRDALFEEATARERLTEVLALQAEQQAIVTERTHAMGAMAEGALGSGAAAAYDTLVDAMDNATNSQKIFSAEMGRALQNALAETLRSVGQEAAVRAVLELAHGFGALARYDPVSASNHFTSAAVFGTTAALAGAASAAISVAPASGGGGGAGAGTGGGGGLSSASDVSQVFQQIVVIGELDAGGAEDLNAQLAKARESRDLSDF